jgi:hypothetical protein
MRSLHKVPKMRCRDIEVSIYEGEGGKFFVLIDEWHTERSVAIDATEASALHNFLHAALGSQRAKTDDGKRL